MKSIILIYGDLKSEYLLFFSKDYKKIKRYSLCHNQKKKTFLMNVATSLMKQPINLSFVLAVPGLILSTFFI